MEAASEFSGILTTNVLDGQLDTERRVGRRLAILGNGSFHFGGLH